MRLCSISSRGVRCTLSYPFFRSGSLLCSLWSCRNNPMLAVALLWIPVPDLAVITDMANVLGQGEGFSWYGYLSARLTEDVDTGAVFPLRDLDPNIVCRHPGPLDALVCGPHQSDGDLTLDVSTRPVLGLSPLCFEADVYTFQVSRRLHNQYPINEGDEGKDVSYFLGECLQVHLLLWPICLLKTLFRCLSQMGLGVCVHTTHFVNSGSTIFPEVTGQEVSLLIRVL